MERLTKWCYFPSVHCCQPFEADLRHLALNCGDSYWISGKLKSQLFFIFINELQQWFTHMSAILLLRLTKSVGTVLFSCFYCDVSQPLVCIKSGSCVAALAPLFFFLFIKCAVEFFCISQCSEKNDDALFSWKSTSLKQLMSKKFILIVTSFRRWLQTRPCNS